MLVSVDVSTEDIVRSIPKDELIEFIVDADLQIAETDFTHDLIERLAESIAQDDREETIKFLRDLADRL